MLKNCKEISPAEVVYRETLQCISKRQVPVNAIITTLTEVKLYNYWQFSHRC
jgi:hypothetical protein